MAVLTPQRLSRAGVGVVLQAAAAGGDSFPAGSGRALRVVNGSGGAITVTINSQRPCDQGFDHDLTVSVPAAGSRDIAGLDFSRFADASGNVLVTYSGVTSLTVGVVEVP